MVTIIVIVLLIFGFTVFGFIREWNRCDIQRLNGKGSQTVKIKWSNGYQGSDYPTDHVVTIGFGLCHACAVDSNAIEAESRKIAIISDSDGEYTPIHLCEVHLLVLANEVRLSRPDGSGK